MRDGMLLTLVVVLILMVGIAHADMPAWREAPQEYSLANDAVTAYNGGVSGADRYLLTRNEYDDFIFSFDVTRLEGDSAKLRAIAVWGVDPSDHARRASFFLPINGLAPGESTHFDVVKTGNTAILKRDGETVSTNPGIYGQPLGRAPLGLLHYYDYHFRYTNISVVPLSARELPTVTDLRTDVASSGVVTVSWDVPKLYRDLVQFKVYRREANAARSEEICQTRETTITDLTAKSGNNYMYSVATLIDKRRGTRSKSVTAEIGYVEPPKPVQALNAKLRIDGSANLAWEAPEESRIAGYTITRGDEVLVKGLSTDATSFVASASEQSNYSVITEDPDGRKDAVAHVQAEPTAPVVVAGAPWPTRHPYLRYSAEDIDRVRRLVRTDEAAAQTLRAVTAQADQIILKPPTVPRERTDEHRTYRGTIDAVATAYAMSGDDQYAAWVREAMLIYADIYPTFEPFSGGRARIVGTGSGLYEATWYVEIICDYDLTYDSPVYSEEDHAKIAENFLRPAAELFWVRDYENRNDYRANDLHYKCYNFQAWFDAAIGLTGLLLRDPEMVDHAINGPYGFVHLVKHDLHDDGIFWERSFGYNGFVVSALQPLMEACWHCNMDLYNLQVADDYNEDRENIANYVVDGDNGPKTIKLIYDGPMYALYGDRTYAAFGDSGRGPHRAGINYLIAWNRYRDPKYAWLYWQDKQMQGPDTRIAGDLEGTIRAAFDDSTLYIAGSISDNVVRNTYSDPAEAWRGDLLWMGLRWTDAPGSGYDFIYGLTPGDGDKTPPVPVIFNRFGATSHTISAGEYKVKRSERGYDIEFAIPWNELAPQDGEDGTALQPADGMQITLDFVLYDCDAQTGSTTKEKMRSWACMSDRYDSTQGGTLVFGAYAGDHQRVINAPRTADITIDGILDDWQTLDARPAIISAESPRIPESGGGSNLHALVYPQPPQSAAAFDYLGDTFCNNGIMQAGCSLFPSTGCAVLRERLENGFPPVDATCSTLSYGPHGGGHGHSDKLNIVLYADGKQWLPDFGSCGYDSKEKGTWTAQTISHNTLVMDQISQLPTGDRHVTWPTDYADSQTRGYLDFFECDELVKAVGAHNSAAYENATFKRANVMIGDVLIDFVAVDADKTHEFDYPLHIAGPLLESSVELEKDEGTLGEKCGYQHIDKVQTASTNAPIDTLWGDDARRLAISCAPGQGTNIIAAESITTALDQKMPMLIVQRSGERALFASVMQPLSGDAQAQEVAWIDAGENAVAAQLAVENGIALVVYNATGQPVTVDGYTVRKQIGVRVTKADGSTETREY